MAAPPKQMKVKVPEISIGGYEKLIDQIGQMSRVACPYCGNETFASEIKGYWICSYCENVISGPDVGTRTGISEASLIISDINKMIATKDYVGASAAYETLAKKYVDAAYWYRCGLLYFEYSNAEVSAIRYNRMGFMEENAVHREKASALTSRAKLLLYKALKICQNAFDQRVAGPQTAFTYAIISAKLDNPRGIKKAMAILESMKSEFLEQYAAMIYSATMLDYDATLSNASRLISEDSLCANAFYYVAWALFKKGRNKDAMRLLNRLGNFLHTPSMDALAKEIIRARSL